MTDKIKPIEEVRTGKIKAAIFAYPNEDGTTTHRVTFARIYKPKEGSWKSTTFFYKNDLTQVMDVVSKAIDRLSELEPVNISVTEL